MSEMELHILRHSLGNETCYRNYFAAEPGGDDYKTILGLVERGLMRAGLDLVHLRIFHVNEAGIRAAFPNKGGGL